MPDQIVNFTVSFGILGQKSFASLDEFRQWYTAEREFWKWLNEVRRPAPSCSQQAEEIIQRFYTLVERFIQETRVITDAQQFQVKVKGLVSQIEPVLQRNPVIFSNSPQAQFLAEIRQENPCVAAAAAGALMGAQPLVSTPDTMEGHVIAIAYKHGLRDVTKSQRAALNELNNKWQNLLDEGKGAFDASAKRLEELGNQFVRQLETQQNSFDELAASTKARLQQVADESEVRLKNIEKTYDEKLALQAAVQYWKIKAKNHGTSANYLAVASSVVGVVVAVFIGIEVFLAIGPLQQLGELPLWKGAMLLLTAVIGIWAIRILVRLLLSHLHLKADAIERRTMLLTYLALLRRGQGPTEQQRELLLHILFRPAASGLVKDDALPPMIAQWLNTVTN